MQADQRALSPWALGLGYAGLLPQLLAVLLAYLGGETAFVAIAGGFAYAAAIFSFLGGVWWGQALMQSKAVEVGRSSGLGAAFIAAVAPSLISVAAFLPWSLGWSWPGPALMILGVLISASPLVDTKLAFANAAFMKLRWHLSIGLGGLTFVLGLIAEQIV